MATIGGSNIVRSGLVLNLDAASPRSYPGSGTSWRDVSGNNNNGTLTNGPTFSSANAGSIVFDGTNDYVNLGNPSILTVGTNPFTIESFFYLSNYGSVFGKDQSTVPGYQFRSGFSSNRFYFMISNSNNTDSLYTTNYNLLTPNVLNLNSWYHLCITRTGITYTMYINGSQIITANTNTIIDHINTTNYYLGASVNASNTGPVAPLSGNIAVFRQYNVLLTFEQILQNYNSTKTRFDL